MFRLILAFLCLATFGYADAASVKAYCLSQLPNNTNGQITPATLRNCINNVVDNVGTIAPVVSATLVGNGNSVTVQVSGATTSSTLYKRYSGVIDPYLDTGAVGDGVTVDYAATVNGLNAVPTGGLFKISQPLNMGSNSLVISRTDIGIMFEGAGKLLANPGYTQMKIAGSSNINVYNLNVAGLNTASRTDIPCVWVNNGSSNIKFYGGQNVACSGAGFLFGNVNGYLVQGVTVSGSLADGIGSHNEGDGAPQNGIISNNNTINTGDDGISVVTYTSDSKIGTSQNIQVVGNKSNGSTAANFSVIGGQNIQLANNQARGSRGPYSVRVEQDTSFFSAPVDNLQMIGMQIESVSGTGLLIGKGVHESSIQAQISGTTSRCAFLGSNSASNKATTIQLNITASNCGSQGIETNGIDGFTGYLGTNSTSLAGITLGANTSRFALDLYAKNAGLASPTTYQTIFINGAQNGILGKVESLETTSTSIALPGLMRVTNVSNVAITSLINSRNGVTERPAQDSGGGAVINMNWPVPNTSRDAGGISATAFQGLGNNISVQISNTGPTVSLTNIFTASSTVLPVALTGAVPNDGNDDYNGFQNGHNQILTRMLSQTTNIPSGFQTIQSGNYNFTQGLKRYTAIGLGSQGGAVNLGFAGAPSGTVMVSISSAGFTASNTTLPGQGFAQQGDAMVGINGVINISGSLVDASSTGIYLGNNLSNTTVTGQDTALTRIENVRVEGAGSNLWLGGYNTYLNHFYKYNSRTPLYSHILVQDDTDGTDNNSGENQLFVGSVFSGGTTSQSTPVIRYRSQARNITTLGTSMDFIHGNLVQVDDIGAGAMGYSLTQLLDGHLENFDAIYAGFAPNIAAMQVRVDGNRIFPGAMRSDAVTPNAFDRPWFYTNKTNGWENILFMNNNIGKTSFDDSSLSGLYAATSGTTLIGQCANNTFDEDRQLCHQSLNPFYNSQFENSVVGTDMRWGYTPNLVLGNQTSSISLTIVSRPAIAQLAGTNALQMTGAGFFNYSTEYAPIEQGKQFMFQGLFNGQDTVTGTFDYVPTVECARPYAWQPLTVTNLSKSTSTLTVTTNVSSSAMVTNSLVYLNGVSPTAYTNRPFILTTDCSNATSCAFRVPTDLPTPVALTNVTPTLVPAQFQSVNVTSYPTVNISSTYGDTANLAYNGTRNYPIKKGPMDTLTTSQNRDITLRYPGCSYLRTYGSIDTGASSVSSTLFYGFAANQW